MAALHAMDFLEAVMSYTAPVERLNGIGLPHGRTVLDVSYSDLPPGDLCGAGVHRHALFHVLHSAAVACDVEVRTGTTVSNVVAQPASSTADGFPSEVLQWTEAGISGTQEEEFDLVVACDGNHSQMRSILCPGGDKGEFDYGACWAVAHDVDGIARTCLEQRYRGSEVMAGLMPAGAAPAAVDRPFTGVDLSGVRYDAATDGPADLLAVFWSLPRRRMDDFTVDEWAAGMRELWPESEGVVAQLEGDEGAFTFVTYADVRLGRSPSFGQDGRPIIVIGDAAHGTSPQLGQGANMAIADALELARAVRRSLDRSWEVDEGGAAATDLEAVQAAAAGGDVLLSQLDLVARNRAAVTDYTQLASRYLTPFFQGDMPVGGWLRDIFLGPMCHLPYFQDQVLRSLCGVKNGLLSSYNPADQWAPYAWERSWPKQTAQERGAAAAQPTKRVGDIPRGFLC